MSGLLLWIALATAGVREDVDAAAEAARKADPARAAALAAMEPGVTRNGMARFPGEAWRGEHDGALLLARLLDGGDDEATRAALAEAVRHTDAPWGAAFAWHLAVEPSAAVREVEADALRRWSGPEAVPALVSTLRDADPAVRAAAARSLGGRPDGALAGETLLVALADPSPHVRAAAARSVGLLGLPRERLAPLLSDPDERVRVAAERGMSR